MKIYRIMAIGLLITFIAIGYVHQRVEMVKTAYELQENRQHLAALIDQNSNLSYDLSKLESPSYLLAVLESEGLEFAGRRSGSRSRYILSSSERSEVKVRNGLIERVMDIFTLSAEAKPRG